MHSGRGSEDESCVWSWKTQGDADESCENDSEHSSSTCRRQFGIIQDLVWPSSVRQELPLNTPVSWEKERSKTDLDTIETDLDHSSSGNATNSSNHFLREFLIDPDAKVKPPRQASRHYRTYKVNPFFPQARREALRVPIAIRRSSRPVPPSLQFPISEGAIIRDKCELNTRKPLLRRPYFNTYGVLPFQYPHRKDMEEEATQKATQPCDDLRRNENQPMLSEEDEGDVICVLHPASGLACEIVDLIVEATPQHVLTRVLKVPEKPENRDNNQEDQDDMFEDHDDIAEDQGDIFEDQGNIIEDQHNMPEDQDNMLEDQNPQPELQDANSGHQRPTSPRSVGSSKKSAAKKYWSNDIALRFSSRLRNPCMGFVFGRDRSSCDLVLSKECSHEKLISKAHFRMFFNHLGVLMLEDISTNGTVVNGERLQAKTDNKKRMIAGGEVIEIVLSRHANRCMRFIVAIPTRCNPNNRFAHNLAKYIAWLDQEARRAEVLAQAAVDGRPQINPAVIIPFNPFNDPIKDLVPSDRELFDNDNLLKWNLTNKKFNHGMEWSGGDRFNVVGHIGRGAFATVFKLATKRDGEYFAAKQIEKRHFMRNNAVDNKIHNEINIMKRLSHPNIVQFIDHQDERHHLYIIMEFVPGGDLTSFIKAGTAMAEYMCQSVAEQICDAVKYLHECNVTHRDIKPDNILIQTRDPLVVKLSDFGLSKWVANEEETMLKSFCGTLLYCAPEIYPEYGLYKAGVQGKRARNKHAPLKTSPYKPSVDTWALGAVIYHLLCGSPPFRGGSSDDRGSSMLEIVMTSPLDRGRLKNAGVSDEGIDFVSKMLVVDPAGRSTEAELLKHAWLTKTGLVNMDDVQVEGGASALDSIDDGGSDLDASQLSLAENPLDHKIDDSEDSEDDLTTEVDEISGGRGSKRFKLGSPRRGKGLSTDDISYPHLRGEPSESAYSEVVPPPSATTGRLFGEIGASALRSSGVLGYDAHAALEMPLEGSRDESFSISESWIDGARMITDQGPFSAARSAQARPGLVSMGAAPSLFGAEALVGQMNMTSLASSRSAPSSESTFESRHRTLKSQDASVVPARLVPGSRGLSQAPTSVTDHPKHQMKKLSVSETHSNLNQSRGASTDEGIQRVGAELGKPTNPRSLVLATATAQETASANEGATKVGVGSIGGTNFHAQKSTSQSHHAARSRYDPVTSVSDESQVSERPARDATSPLSFPKPPPRFGTLTALPGSLCNTTIRLEQRITYYGRDPSSHVQHPNMKETRIPKNALDIIFWRPGIEAMIESGKDWSTLEGLYAIAHTRTTRNIKVNGVKLTKGEGCWNYGRLHTGDVITIFGPTEGEGEQPEGKAAAEFLKFRCEFSLGLSAQQRPADQPRFVVEKEEEKFMQKQLRRSASVASQDSRSTT